MCLNTCFRLFIIFLFFFFVHIYICILPILPPIYNFSSPIIKPSLCHADLTAIIHLKYLVLIILYENYHNTHTTIRHVRHVQQQVGHVHLGDDMGLPGHNSLLDQGHANRPRRVVGDHDRDLVLVSVFVVRSRLQRSQQISAVSL